MGRTLNQSDKRGCPTCNGIAAKSCMRCHGQTKMNEWSFHDGYGWCLDANGAMRMDRARKIKVVKND